MMKWFKYCVFLLLMQGCIDEVPLEQNANSPQSLVIQCFIHPDSFVQASVAQVSRVTSTYNWINNANLALVSSNNTIFNFNRSGTGIYQLLQKFKVNDSLKFRIDHALLNSFIDLKIPSAIKIKRLDTFTSLVSNVGKTKVYRIYFKDSAYNKNYYRIYGIRHFKQYLIDNVLGTVDSSFYEDKLPIGGAEVCFQRNVFNNYTTKEILFSDEIMNGTDAKFEFYETLPRTTLSNVVLYQIDIYLENIDENIFNYYNSRNAHIWQQSSITQLPTNVNGNIPNGFGVVGAYTNDVVKIILKN